MARQNLTTERIARAREFGAPARRDAMPGGVALTRPSRTRRADALKNDERPHHTDSEVEVETAGMPHVAMSR